MLTEYTSKWSTAVSTIFDYCKKAPRMHQNAIFHSGAKKNSGEGAFSTFGTSIYLAHLVLDHRPPP